MLHTRACVCVSMENREAAPSCSSSFSFSFFSDAGNEHCALTRFLYGCWDCGALFLSKDSTSLYFWILFMTSSLLWNTGTFPLRAYACMTFFFFFWILNWKTLCSDCSCHASVVHLLFSGSSFIVFEVLSILLGDIFSVSAWGNWHTHQMSALILGNFRSRLSCFYCWSFSCGLIRAL